MGSSGWLELTRIYDHGLDSDGGRVFSYFDGTTGEFGVQVPEAEFEETEVAAYLKNKKVDVFARRRLNGWTWQLKRPEGKEYGEYEWEKMGLAH